MNCLWLTRKYPRPANSGELIYSNGLIRSFAKAGAKLTVLAHDNDEVPVGKGGSHSEYVDDDNVKWQLGTPDLGGRFTSLFTRYPSDSWRLKNGGPEEALVDALENESWDAIIIDHAALGWAFRLIQRAKEKGVFSIDPVVVYLSHNHEAKIRREIARNSKASLPRRIALQLDAEKYARQEEMLCREVDLVTAITDTEVEAYRENFPSQQYISLTPGYEGMSHQREITEATPRRVVMSGSFEWVAKRINLERFLEQAASPLEEAGIELQIVGKADDDYRREISDRFPGVDMVGRVPEMTSFLLKSRMGLIVEEFGGGFKLKTLEYIFHGLPLAGLDHAVEGLPLSSPENVLLTADTGSLISAIIEKIDDYEALNRMQKSSLEICESSFRWEDRGRKLYHQIEAMRAVALAG
ncbi:glycosyltransferase [Verrucomicrobiales bacterium BCK34]|nr:glycosyltransferase [Verrucomicrobiales bacterium BCK34]